LAIKPISSVEISSRSLKQFPVQGSRIFEHTEAGEFTERPSAIKANGQKILCRYVVLATHTPLTGKTGIVSGRFFRPSCI
jgi:hypothetical protein